MTLQLRRGLDSDLPSNPAEGEPLVALDTQKLYIGIGGTPVLFAEAGAGGGSGTVDSASTILLINETVDSAYVQARVNLDSVGGGGGGVYINKDEPTAPDMGQQWLETPDSGEAVMWIWDGVYWVESPTGKDGAPGAPGSSLASTDELPEGSTNLYYTDARADIRATLIVNSATTDNIGEGTTNLYYSDSHVSEYVDSAYIAARTPPATAQVDYVTTVGYNPADPSDVTSIVLNSGDASTPATFRGDIVDNSSNVILDVSSGLLTGTVLGATAGSVTNNAGSTVVLDGENSTLNIVDITASGTVDFTSATVNGLPSAPVSSVNTKVGAVVLDASDVGALPDTYSAPVASVNTKVGAVVLDYADVGAQVAGSYATSGHNHSGVYQPVGSYALVGDAYTKAESNAAYQAKGDSYTKAESNAAYQAKGSYATADHNHSGVYAASTHTHSQLHEGGTAVKVYTYASGGRVTGNLLVTANVTAYYSDERLKDVVGSIEDPVEKVKSIDTFYYTHNDKAHELGYEGTEKQVGVSAQSVKAVAPEVVHRAPVDDDGEGGSVSGEDYLTVDYARLVPLLIESIKQLSAEIEELKSK